MIYVKTNFDTFFFQIRIDYGFNNIIQFTAKKGYYQKMIEPLKKSVLPLSIFIVCEYLVIEI